MSKIRPEKIATIDDVKSRVQETSTAVVAEYRGLTVAEISQLRRQLRELGADFKVFKNTLVRRAIEGSAVESLGEFLEGPTAITWVKGDVSAVAKALREFAKAAPALVVKGGVLEGRALTLADLTALAELPSREVMLARFAGLLGAPLRNLAGLMQAVPQNFAFGLAALIERDGGVPVEEPVVAETPTGVEEAAPAASDDVAPSDVEPEAPVAEADETAPADDADATPVE